MANIRKRNGRYQVQIRRRGFPSQVKTFSRHSDAKRWALQTELNVERGELEARPAPSHHTIGDLIERYQATFELDDPDTWRLRALTRDLGHLRADRLKSSDLARYRDQRLKRIQATSLKRDLTTLRRVLKIALDEWDVSLSLEPINRVSIKSGSISRNRRLDPPELTRLLKVCSNGRNLWLKPAVILAIETAMRRGELLNARYEHLKDGLLYLPKTKTGHPRTIPLTPKCVSLISTLPRSITGYLIPITASALRQSFNRAKRRAGIDDFHFHDLRHEAISRFFEMGLSIPEVALISGHKDYRMLARYTHLRADDLLKKLHVSRSKALK